MKKILLIVVISLGFISCSDIEALNSIKQVEDFVQKIQQNPDSDVCSEGIPLLTNVVNGNKYQTNVLQIIDLLDRIPQIKKCEGYSTLGETLSMAQGYKNVPWGASLDTVRKAFGKMRLISWRENDEPDINWTYFGSISEVLGTFPKMISDSDRHMVRVYANGEKRFAFYRNKFFAYFERLPSLDEENKMLYLQKLRKKYGNKDSYSKQGLCTAHFRILTQAHDDLHTWVFGNSYVALCDNNRIAYIDKNVLDELSRDYELTQIKQRNEQKTKQEQQTKQLQTVANNL